ncbi:MAG: hypothetical protein HF978_19945 [Desulfobacteraceae bacterium]|nr:hypothetical protein [Desulfobacteraceae bacterium]MBC2757821.1 hypothetical protein [Desulfobacteraceae bacterium]
MKNPDDEKVITDFVTEIYAAVFPVPVSKNLMTEVILAGYKRDPDLPKMLQIKATVETHVNAVPDLIALCDEIVDEQGEIESYRLLKFDKEGIHILNPDDFRTLEQKFKNVRWGTC